VIHYIKRRPEIISKDAEEALDKIEKTFLTKTHQQAQN
jgi:hypothetical protein